MVLEKALLIGIQRPNQTRLEAQDSLRELNELARTAGAEVLIQSYQQLKKIHSATFIGKGKVAEIESQIKSNQIEVVFIDDDLTPTQQSTLEDIFCVKVLDRTGLILDIFSKRARSKEGKLQVELAQLTYMLPRLKGHGNLMSRLGAGIGTRGPGETKLETDRRRIRDRIARLKKEIELVKKTRSMHRAKRQNTPIPIVALVGYTNAGKSTLLHQLTGADILCEDKLFATLDPTTRKLKLPGQQTILLTDTVGFIKKIPIQLVDAFRATLEEVMEADLLLHVIDISHSSFEAQAKEVVNTLKHLNAHFKKILHVYNKADQVENIRSVFIQHGRLDPFCVISAKEKRSFDLLFDKIESLLKDFYEEINIKIPVEDQKILAEIHAQGQVSSQKYFKKSVRIIAQVTHKFAKQLKKRYVS